MQGEDVANRPTRLTCQKALRIFAPTPKAPDLATARAGRGDYLTTRR